MNDIESELQASFKRMRSLATFSRERRLPDMPFDPHIEACENLVKKARRVWISDRARADRYLELAGRFPYNEPEQAYPLLWACHLELFNEISDTVENSAEHDETWLDAALVLLDHPDEIVRVEVAEVLRNVKQDYRLPKREKKRIAETCAGHPELDDFLNPPIPEATVRAYAAATISAVIQYGDELVARA